MTTEELKLKVSLDTSGLKQDVAKVKTTMKGAEESLSGKKMSQGSRDTANALSQVADQLQSIKGMGIAGFITMNLGAIRTAAGEFMGAFDFKNFDLSGEKGFGKIKAAIQSMKISTNEAFASLGQAMGGISAGMAAAVVALGVVLVQVLAIVAATKMAINNAKEIAQLSREAQKIGLSTHAYEEWGYILKQNGVEIDKLSDFLKTLADEQNAVREGSEDIIQAFEKIGISADEAANMNQSDLFAKTVEGLQGVENSVERTGIAYKIFGEDAAQLMPILSMNSQEIAQLRQNYELLGGAASATLVQRSQQLQSSLGNLSQAWQGVKNSITEALLPAIIAVVNWLTKAIAVIGMFFRAILGTDTKHADKSTASMSTGMSSYTSAVDGATAAVQKLKREQMGFDELNVLPGKDESSGGGSGSPSSFSSGGGGLGDMDIPTVEDLGLGKIQDWFNKYKTTIQDITTWSLIGIGTIGCVIALLTGNIPAAIMFAGVAGLGIAIGSVEGGTFDRVGKAIFEWWDGKLKPWWNKVKVVFTKEFWILLFANIVAATQQKLAELKTKIEEKTKPIRDWFNKNVKSKFTKEYWIMLFATIVLAASEKLESARKTISDKWTTIKNWFDKNVKSKFTKDYWSGKFDTIRSSLNTKITEAQTVISSKWATIKNWFNKNIKPKFTTAYWKGKFDTIKSGARSAFNGVISIVESAVNNIIKKINTLSWKIPDWVPKVGGSKFGFNFKTVSIPRLATGGIATRSVLANIGENGREAVLPLENNTSWMDTLADKIAARSGTPGKLFLQVDGKTLGWVAIDNINKITKQTGEIQLAL